MSAIDLLRKLSEASGVSGYEHAVRDLVIQAFRPYSDEIIVTAMGSIIALKRGTLHKNSRSSVPKVLIEGHIDEIGLMVTEIDKGFLRFTQVGGFDARVLPFQQVLVHGKRPLPGIIGSRVPPASEDPEHRQVTPMDDLFIDVGMPEPQVRGLVRPGDLVTIARRMLTLKNNLVAGKAFDDRSAVVCVAEALRHLNTIKPAWDVYAVANVQEEVGLRGAMTSTFQVNPDVAIAVDVGHADQPNVSEINAVPLNEGMGIALGPNIHPVVHQRLTKIAEANQIPYRVTAYEGATGTNAWAMQVVREGVPTGLIDIPLRYMHTSVETVSIADLERVGRLLANFCASLDAAFLAELRGEAPKEAAPPRKKTTRGRRPRTEKRRKKR